MLTVLLYLLLINSPLVTSMPWERQELVWSRLWSDQRHRDGAFVGPSDFPTETTVVVGHTLLHAKHYIGLVVKDVNDSTT